MNEPHSIVTATAVGAAGVGSLILSVTGVDPQVFLYAAAGAYIGALRAPPLGLLRAIGVWVAVVLLSSVLGVALAEAAGLTKLLQHGAVAAGIALVFHPALTAVVDRVPRIFDAILDRLGVKR